MTLESPVANAVASNPERLRKVFARLDAAEDPSGQDVAFHIADAALRSAGLTWSKLLDNYLGKANDTAASDFGNMFEGIFTSFSESVRPSHRASPPQPRQKFLQGEDIPESISGYVKLIDERKTRDGMRMLVVHIADEHTIFGPLVIFNSSEIERLEQNKDALLQARVRQPQNKRHMPILYGLRAA